MNENEYNDYLFGKYYIIENFRDYLPNFKNFLN